MRTEDEVRRAILLLGLALRECPEEDTEIIGSILEKLDILAWMIGETLPGSQKHFGGLLVEIDYILEYSASRRGFVKCQKQRSFRRRCSCIGKAIEQGYGLMRLRLPSALKMGNKSLFINSLKLRLSGLQRNWFNGNRCTQV